jgi:hypothetical protein
MSHWRLALTVCVHFALAAPAARAQNLVVNPEFDTNVDSWTIPIFIPPGGATLSWSPLDWNGNPGSGSAFVTNELSFANSIGGAVSTCMVVPTTGLYEYGAQILIPSGQATTGEVFVARAFWEAPGCVGIAKIFIDQVVTTATTDVWVPILIQGFTETAGTELQIFLGINKDQAAGTLAAHFDFVRFGLQGTTPVGLLDFEVE